MEKSNLRMVSAWLVIVALILSLTTMGAFAATATVYGRNCTVAKGEEITIPIYISDNPGIMGLSILFSFNSKMLEPVKVKRGTLLASGMFDDSIGADEDGRFKVIWCGTGNINSNGELFDITFRAKESFSGTQTIHVSFESENTFDEKWANVNLNGEDIKVFEKDSTVNSDEPTTGEAEDNKDEEENLNFFQRIAKFFRDLFAKIKAFFLGLGGHDNV